MGLWLLATSSHQYGVVDAQQKGVLKDLLIIGDEAMQSALDKYQSGDTAELEVR